MSSLYKKILIVGVILFLIQTICRTCIILDFKSDFIEKIALITVPISTIILLAYAGDKGKDLLCKVGIVFVLANIILTGLQAFEVINPLKADSDKFIYSLIQFVDGGLQLCGMLALLSLIPPLANKFDYIKKAAIGGYALYIIISSLYFHFDFDQWEWMMKAGSVSHILSTAAEYMFIVTYLLNKTISTNEEALLDDSISKQSYVGAPNVPLQQMMPQHPMVTPQQAVPAAPQVVPTSPPAVEQTVLMPVIQQPQINNQVANQPEVQAQPIVQSMDNNQQ